MEDRNTISRRRVLGGLGGLALAATFPPRLSFATTGRLLRRNIPSSGEALPVIGMGSWITFDVGDQPAARGVRVDVLKTFFEAGGAVVDSSPMYGHSEEVIGYCLERMEMQPALFAATKVWTTGKKRGMNQMDESEELWGVERFDLMQIHNMQDWETHLETLRAWKAEGRIRYIGITTSHGRRHDRMASVIEKEDAFDFVQFTYNIRDRAAEQRLLPVAAEHGKAVIINRPFRRGELFRYVDGRPLPDWAGEFDCQNWAQFFLKFIVSHPSVTCAIPATSRVDHMQENMGACYGRLPEPKMRQRMIQYFESV